MNVSWLIAGLGNPGRAYEKTRHNAGFWICDALSKRWGFTFTLKKFKARAARTVVQGVPVMLIKPQTYMNRSGESVSAFARYYHVSAEKILLLYDDMDLPHGALRLRKSGGAAGHKGVESVIAMLETKNIHRIRFGIGKPENSFIDGADYVLEKISRDGMGAFQNAVENACDAVETIIEYGFDKAMNTFNSKTESSSGQ